MTCALFACIALAACKKDPATEPDPVKYTVTVSAGENGKAAVSVAEAEAGAEVTFTATPDEGFAFDKWTVEKGNVTVANPAENPLKVIMPKENISLSASFVALKFPHAIKVAEAENGTVTVEGDLKEALEGVSVTVTAVPAEGFEFKGWTLDGVEVEDLAANPLTFVMPDAEVTVAAEFKEIFNVLDAIADPVLKAYIMDRMENQEKLADPVSGENVLVAPWDSNADGILSEDEAANVKYFILNGGFAPLDPDAEELGYDDKILGSLDGIEYFTGLEVLDLTEAIDIWSATAPGESYDLSKLENLVYVNFDECSYEGRPIILGNKPALKTLYVGYDLYVEGDWTFDLSGCKNLTYINLGTSAICDAEEVDCSMIEDPACVIKGSNWAVTLLRQEQEEAFLANNTNPNKVERGFSPNRSSGRCYCIID